MTRAGLPHSETPGSTLPCQLPRAYRRLERPSSALDAKASTMCPYQLAKQTHNTTNNTTQRGCAPAGHGLEPTKSIRDTTNNTNNHHTTNHTHPTTVRAECSRPLSKNQETRTLPAPTRTERKSTRLNSSH